MAAVGDWTDLDHRGALLPLFAFPLGGGAPIAPNADGGGGGNAAAPPKKGEGALALIGLKPGARTAVGGQAPVAVPGNPADTPHGVPGGGGN